MIEQEKYTQDYYSINCILDEIKKEIPNPTAKEALEYILGDKDGWGGDTYVVCRYMQCTKRSLIQRLNALWFYPLFIISVPFQFVIYGKIGAKRSSFLGKLINKLIKFD